MIKDYLLKGHDNARTLAELEELTGKPGRIIRRQINEERRETIILNMQDGSGYFLPDASEADLVRRWVKQEESRLKLHALSLRAGRKAIREAKQ